MCLAQLGTLLRHKAHEEQRRHSTQEEHSSCPHWTWDSRFLSGWQETPSTWQTPLPLTLPETQPFPPRWILQLSGGFLQGSTLSSRSTVNIYIYIKIKRRFLSNQGHLYRSFLCVLCFFFLYYSFNSMLLSSLFATVVQRLDLMTLKIFSSVNDSMILCFCVIFVSGLITAINL